MLRYLLARGRHLARTRHDGCWKKSGALYEVNSIDRPQTLVLILPPRYLTKLCDQIVCLVSEEDAVKVAEAQGWHAAAKRVPPTTTRLFVRKVTRTAEQEENATGSPGPTVGELGLTDFSC